MKDGCNGNPQLTDRVSVNWLKFDVDRCQTSDVCEWISEHAGQKAVIANHNLHSIYLVNAEPDLRNFYETSDLILADGFPIWLLIAIRTKVGNFSKRKFERIGSTDWILSRGFGKLGMTIALVGASKESNMAAIRRLQVLHPSNRYVGWDGYAELEELRREDYSTLRRSGASLVLVGLGMPLQEKFIAAEWDNLPPAIYATVGGALDQLSGSQSLCPRWLGRIGAEWLWRLFSDPRRLAFRYLAEPVLLIVVLVKRAMSGGGL
ncbi:N-acetylglucosaminyldiphosphoundecaprenol N-acetyl-beta-D-mannosaminyltransferase [Williamsia muralis]|nr:N-acetylglucosaminyldiphosphoundecaprenol N-acetyl-beta-D-mannosaminyltransferase [Williamsia marianensis]